MVIQRIQSLYLFLVTILLVVAAFLPVGFFVDDVKEVCKFTPLYIDIPGSGRSYAVFGMFVILMLSVAVSFLTIFLYKKIILQIRLSIFNIILLVGYHFAFLASWLMVKDGLYSKLELNWAVALPIVCIILVVMAIRAMSKDDKLLKSVNSMRLRD